MRQHVERAVLRLAAAALTLLVTLGVVACKQSDDRAQPPAATGVASQADAVFNVQGMHCATCPVTVRTAAKGVDGVVEVRVSMEEARAWVKYDARKTSPATIAKAITESGYPAMAMSDPNSPAATNAER